MRTQSFRYVAVDGQGERSRGVVRGTDTHDAFRKLAAAGMTPVSIDEVKSDRTLLSGQRIRTSDVSDLTRELAVLVAAKIPLDRGLVSIAEHDGKPAVTRMVRDIAMQIESGVPLTQALARHQRVFGDVYIQTIRSAERSGNLAAVMEHLADMLERQLETRQQLTRAMTYPVIVMAVVAMALTIIVVFVVPKFGTTFAAQGVKMPLATRIVQGLGTSVADYWPAYAACAVAMILAPIFAWRSRAGREWCERVLMRLPYVSKVMVSVSTGRFSRVLGIALASGLDVIESIEIAGRSTGSLRMALECEAAGVAMRQGEPLVDAVKPIAMLPPFAKRMLGAGKDSAEVSRACEVLARHYDRESSHLTKNLSSVIEPVMTVAMACIVLLVALSVFLPMWQMVSNRH
jgi:type II secretory pathway component PulF